jgi:hypothetical protein
MTLFSTAAATGASRGVALPGIAPSGGAFLKIGIHDDDALAVLLGRDGGMHGKGGLTAAAFLAEES